MNIKRNIFAMLAAGVLLASCSQDEMMTDAGHDGLVRVTLSAAVDEGVQARVTSTEDDALGRCLVQILEKEKEATEWTKGAVQGMTESNGTYTLANVMLNPDKDYTFLFWADGGERHYAAADLTAVTMAEAAQGAGIAYQTKVTWDGSEEVEAELTHAVTKVSLNSTTAVPATTTVTVTVPKAYGSFNVLDGTVSGEATASYAHSGPGTAQAGNQFSFYALVDDEIQTLTLNAGGSDASIASVPLGPDKHIILEGDVAGAGWTGASFSVSAAKDWGEESPAFVDGYKIDADGTYIVTTAEGLQAWAKAVQSGMFQNCKLAADITLPAVEEGGSNWTTVPNFTGTFDGNRKVITGLTGEGGLFGTIGSEGEVLDLLLEDVKITADGFSDVGAIAGTNQGTVSGCHVVSGSVQSSHNGVGGIVGYNDDGSVVDCSCSATINGYVTGSGSYVIVGGIVGWISGATANVVGCTSTGDVISANNVGGVVGVANAGSIVCCGSTSNVTGEDGAMIVGGVVGSNTGCEVMYCCYSGNQISGDKYVGGVFGMNDGKVTACYWSGYDGDGVGAEFGESEADVTKVDGDWTEAVAALNAAMAGSAYEESYEWITYQGKPELASKKSSSITPGD